jgi:hypothetical protein
MGPRAVLDAVVKRKIPRTRKSIDSKMVSQCKCIVTRGKGRKAAESEA